MSGHANRYAQPEVGAQKGRVYVSPGRSEIRARQKPKANVSERSKAKFQGTQANFGEVLVLKKDVAAACCAPSLPTRDVKTTGDGIPARRSSARSVRRLTDGHRSA